MSTSTSHLPPLPGSPSLHRVNSISSSSSSSSTFRSSQPYHLQPSNDLPIDSPRREQTKLTHKKSMSTSALTVASSSRGRETDRLKNDSSKLIGSKLTPQMNCSTSSSSQSEKNVSRMDKTREFMTDKQTDSDREFRSRLASNRVPRPSSSYSSYDLASLSRDPQEGYSSETPSSRSTQRPWVASEDASSLPGTNLPSPSLSDMDHRLDHVSSSQSSVRNLHNLPLPKENRLGWNSGLGLKRSSTARNLSRPSFDSWSSSAASSSSLDQLAQDGDASRRSRSRMSVTPELLLGAGRSMTSTRPSVVLTKSGYPSDAAHGERDSSGSSQAQGAPNPKTGYAISSSSEFTSAISSTSPTTTMSTPRMMRKSTTSHDLSHRRTDMAPPPPPRQGDSSSSSYSSSAVLNVRSRFSPMESHRSRSPTPTGIPNSSFAPAPVPNRAGPSSTTTPGYRSERQAETADQKRVETIKRLRKYTPSEFELEAMSMSRAITDVYSLSSDHRRRHLALSYLERSLFRVCAQKRPEGEGDIVQGLRDYFAHGVHSALLQLFPRLVLMLNQYVSWTIDASESTSSSNPNSLSNNVALIVADLQNAFLDLTLVLSILQGMLTISTSFVKESLIKGFGEVDDLFTGIEQCLSQAWFVEALVDILDRLVSLRVIYSFGSNRSLSRLEPLILNQAMVQLITMIWSTLELTSSRGLDCRLSNIVISSLASILAPGEENKQALEGNAVLQLTALELFVLLTRAKSSKGAVQNDNRSQASVPIPSSERDATVKSDGSGSSGSTSSCKTNSTGLIDRALLRTPCDFSDGEISQRRLSEIPMRPGVHLDATKPSRPSSPNKMVVRPQPLDLPATPKRRRDGLPSSQSSSALGYFTPQTHRHAYRLGTDNNTFSSEAEVSNEVRPLTSSNFETATIGRRRVNRIGGMGVLHEEENLQKAPVRREFDGASRVSPIIPEFGKDLDDSMQSTLVGERRMSSTSSSYRQGHRRTGSSRELSSLAFLKEIPPPLLPQQRGAPPVPPLPAGLPDFLKGDPSSTNLPSIVSGGHRRGKSLGPEMFAGVQAAAMKKAGVGLGLPRGRA